MFRSPHNGMMRRCRRCGLLLAFILPASVFGAPLPDEDSVDLLPFVSYQKEPASTPAWSAQDPEHIVSLEGWTPSRGSELDFGITTDSYWFKIPLHIAGEGRYVLMIDAASSDLKVWQLSANKSKFYDLGLDRRAEPWVIRHRRPAVELDLPAGETVLLVRLQNEQISRMAPVLWKERAFYEFRTTEVLVYGAFFGAILAIVMYNFFVYLSTRETSYGIYVFYALMAGAYTAVFQGFHIVLFPHWGRFWLVHSVPVFTALVGVGMNLFARSFLQTRVHAPRMDRLHLFLAFVAFCIALAGALPFVAFGPLLKVLASAAMISVAAMLVSGFIVWRRGYAPARYYVLAISTFALAALASSLRLIGVLEHRFWIQHGVQAAMLAEMILLSLALSDRINHLKTSLEKHLRDLAAAHELVAASERKYRVLVEDTSDLIFALDPSGCILSINHAASRILGYAPRAMAGKPVFSFVFQSGRDSTGYETMLLRDQFEKLGKGVLQTRVRFASKQGEPVELQLRLERIGAIGAESEALILGKASLRAEDSLLPSVVQEHGKYAISNFLNLSDLVHQRVTRSLGRYFGPDTRDDIALVLREMLINAIEHGNLGISYEEKTKAQAAGTYMDLIRERQSMKPFMDRRVFVEYSLSKHRIWFRVTDEGPGFDHRSLEAGDRERLRDMGASHGRGIALARALFDVVRYNDAGNSVVLVKSTGSRESSGPEK